MAKNNEIFWKWTRIAITIGVILVSVAVAYATLRERVNTNGSRLDKVEKKAEDNQTALVEMKTDIKYIIKGVDVIKEQLK